MHRTVRAMLAASVLLSPAAAWAEPVDEAAAKKVEEAVRTFGPDAWSAPGLLNVRPDGEGYRLVLDTAGAIRSWIAPWTVKNASPLEVRLDERPDGQWSFDAAGDLKLSTEYLAANRTNAVTLALGSKVVKGVFDPVTVFPRQAEVGFKDATLTMRSAQDTIKLGLKDYRLTSAVRDLPDGRGDVEADFAAQDFTATFGTFPNPEVKLSAARIGGTYRLGKFDLAGLGAITRFWQVTAAGKEVSTLTDADRVQLRTILNDHLPVLDEIGGTLAASDLSISQAGKAFRLETLDYESRWEGMGDRAALVIGARIRNAGVDPNVWPKGFEAVLPQSASMNLRLSSFDMGAFWKDAALLRTERELSLLPRDHMSKIVFPDGGMTVDVTDTSVKSSFYDLTVSGQVRLSMDRASLPGGTLTLTARDFDGTVKYLQDNVGTVPVFGQASFFALMMKGLGKAQPDGSLVWDVKFEDTGKITVNGQPLPM